MKRDGVLLVTRIDIAEDGAIQTFDDDVFCSEVVRTDRADMWAIGCIYAELLSLRPIFKGDEAKLDGKKTLPFQRDQMGKICEVLGPVKGEFKPPSGCRRHHCEEADR